MLFIPQTSFEIRNTKNKGRGVFTLQPIKSGTVIGEYSGKQLPYYLIDPQDYEYLMYLNDEEGIVADKKEIGVHLMNHSCEPNCIMKTTKKATKFVAIRDIQPQEELTISYNFPYYSNCPNCTHQCFCDSTNCSGTMHPLVDKA